MGGWLFVCTCGVGAHTLMDELYARNLIERNERFFFSYLWWSYGGVLPHHNEHVREGGVELCSPFVAAGS